MYPAATLLFAAIDALGSYHRQKPGFEVSIDGKSTAIRSAAQHIYILNSEYFELDLSRDRLDETYDKCRSTLTHNAALPPGVGLRLCISNRPAIFDESGYLWINVGILHRACAQGVNRFLGTIETIVPASHAAKEVQLKDRARVIGRKP